MNERLAFFCDRETTPCHLYTWTCAQAAGAALYQVWCRGRLDDPAPTDHPADDLAAIRARLAAVGGGLIAVTRAVGSAASLEVTTVGAPDEDPATELLLLPPGEPPAWVALGRDALTLAPGAFVLLPATWSDQSQLRAFVDHLQRLPDDYRTLLLNVLRRPGIEGALWRLEHRLDRLAQGPALNDAAGVGLSGARWPALLAGLLLLNLLATLGGVWAVQGWIAGAGNGAAPQPSTRIDTLALPPGWAPCPAPWSCPPPTVPAAPPTPGAAPPGATAPAPLRTGEGK